MASVGRLTVDDIMALIRRAYDTYDKAEIDEFFLNYYTKQEIQDSYYTKGQVDTSFLSYYTQEEIQTLYYDKSQVTVLFSDYYTQTDIQNLYYNKTEIDNIISGVEAGQTYSFRSGPVFPLGPLEFDVFGLTEEQTVGDVVYPAPNVYTYKGGEWVLMVDSYLNNAPPVILHRGLRTITTDQSTPLKVTYKGLTRLNILGDAGSCESLTPFNTSGANVELSTTRFKSGRGSIRMTASASAPYAWRNYGYVLDKDKQYIVAAWVYIESFTSGNIRLTIGNFGTTDSKYFAQGDSLKVGEWQLIYVKVPISNTLVDGTFRLSIGPNASSTLVFHIDDIRLYELSTADYNTIGTTYTTDEQIDAFIPYVDNVKHLQNVYVRNFGKQLLPPFTQWGSDSATGTFSVISAYDSSYTSTSTSAQFIYADIPALPNTTYTVSWEGDNVVYCNLRISDNSSSASVSNPFSTGSVSSQTFTTTSDTGIIRIGYKVSAVGTFTITNPMLNLGSVALPFEEQNDDYIFFQTKAASNVDGSVADEVYYDSNGNARMVERFKKDIPLDNTLTYGFGVDKVGFKSFSTSAFPLMADGDFIFNVVKYDGTILQNISSESSGDFTSKDQIFQISSDKTLRISIADSDSGWGETFVASPLEIACFFLGYKMNNGTFGTNYNGTGTKTWIPWGATDNSSAVVSAPTTPSSAITSGTYDYYRITFQLAQTQDVPVTVEGALSLRNGLNQVEVGEGVIVREAVTPVYFAGGKQYFINRTLGGYEASLLKRRLDIIVNMFENGATFKKFTVTTSTAYGKLAMVIGEADYDPSASYSVTYLALDKYLLTPNIIEATGTYQTNLSTVVAENVKNIADATTRLSVVENNRHQGQELTATLQNGCTGTAKYSKNDLGLVTLQLDLSPGTVTALTTLLTLPIGYRPRQSFVIPLVRNSSGQTTGFILYLHSDGTLRISADGVFTTAVSYRGLALFYGV